MNMEGNMKKEKLFKNKKRGQGFSEYALLAGGIIIIVAIALIFMRDTFENVGRYVRCILRVATQAVGEANQDANYAACNVCLSDVGNNNDLCI
jgi:uncharacterized protein (UPF0333 family)